MVVMFLWCVQEVAGLKVEDFSNDPLTLIDETMASVKEESLSSDSKEPLPSHSECKFTIGIIVGYRAM